MPRFRLTVAQACMRFFDCEVEADTPADARLKALERFSTVPKKFFDFAAYGDPWVDKCEALDG